MFGMSKKIAILGASRGFGRALSLEAAGASKSELLLVSRKQELLTSLKLDVENLGSRASVLCSDFNVKVDQEEVLRVLSDFKPDKVIYCAGGGPHGPYASKKWEDHQWAYNVTFIFAARVLHFCLKNQSFVKQFVAIGSSVCEQSADINAASYSAAKHALLGLHKTVSIEEPTFDFRLFSPSYMDTDMLPPSAPVRLEKKVSSPKAVAMELLYWLEQPGYKNAHMPLSDI